MTDTCYDGEIFLNSLGHYWITLDSLPSETLRVLELTNCRGLCPQPNDAAVVLPRLSFLRLRHCSQDLSSLQRVIDTAPALATIRLEYVLVEGISHDDDQGRSNVDQRSYNEDAPSSPPKEASPRRLRCPAATVLVLERCRWEEEKRCRHAYGGYGYSYEEDEKPVTPIGMEIDAPKLRRFRYMGLVRPFSFSPRPPELEQVDLHFLPQDNWRNRDAERDLENFWRFARGFTSTKEMRLRVKHLEDIAVLREARRVELLPVFRRLERLELQGVHRPKCRTAAVAIANLLRCCPVLRDLRINLTAEHHDESRSCNYADEFLERKFRSDRDKSVDCLDRYGGSKPTMVAAAEGDDDSVNYDDASDIPGLSRWCSTECLRSSLRRVGLQFRFENSEDCLGVKLIRFFTENAMVLDEMHIDAGNKKFSEHINPKVETWIADSSKRRQSGATSFVVLPLNR